MIIISLIIYYFFKFKENYCPIYLKAKKIFFPFKNYIIFFFKMKLKLQSEFNDAI